MQNNLKGNEIPKYNIQGLAVTSCNRSGCWGCPERYSKTVQIG